MSVPVLDRVPGQPAAIAFLRGAAERPHHAYVFAGPEGSGKSLAARAFAAALLCRRGGCGDCRDCRLAEEHPERIVVIDADKPPADVFDAVRAALDKALGEREEGGGAGSLRPSADPAEAGGHAASNDDEPGPEALPMD